MLCAYSTHQRHAIYRVMVACRMKQPALLYVRPEACRRGVRKRNTPIYVHSRAPVTQRHPDTLAARETQQERARVWGDFSQRASYRGVVTHLHDSWHETPQNGDADSGCIGDARPVSLQCHGNHRYADVILVDGCVCCRDQCHHPGPTDEFDTIFYNRVWR